MVAVVVSTYNPPGGERDKYAIETVQSLVKNLRCSGPCIFRLVLADDGSESPRYLQKCANIAIEGWGTPSIVTQVNRKGIGGSLNAALQSVDFAEFWVYSTDDWVPTKELDIEPALKLIRDENYDYIRLNPLHPNLECMTKFRADIGWWLHLNQQGVNGGFYFGTRPFVATKNFYNTIGSFIEGTDAYEAEADYARRVNRTNLKLGALVDLHSNWLHIGKQEVGRIKPQHQALIHV